MSVIDAAAQLFVDRRPGIRRVIEEPEPRRQLRAFVATQPGVWSRVSPLLRVLEEAAPNEPALAQLRIAHARQRLDGMQRFAALLAERGALRPELSVERATDILWTVCAQATHDALVRDRGWTHDEYRDWLGDSVARLLLDDPVAS